MILNKNYDYTFLRAILKTNIEESVEEYIYTYVLVDEPNENELDQYFEVIDEEFIETEDIEIDEFKLYYKKEISLTDDWEPETTIITYKTPVDIEFNYTEVDPNDQEKLLVIDGIWGKSGSLIIKTFDNISPKQYSEESKEKMSDRVLIEDKFYTIEQVYTEINKNTMLNGADYTTYLLLRY